MLTDRLYTQVINLDDSTDRLAKVTERFDAVGLSFTRCPAFDGRGVPPESLPHYDHWRARLWIGATLTGSEIGCFLSHLKAAKRFLETDRPYGLVFEDDCVVPDGFVGVVEEVLQELERPEARGWRMVNLARQVKVPRDARPIADLAGGKHALCACYDFPASASALIWSRQGAARFLRKNRHIWGNTDNAIRSDLAIWGGGYCLAPPLTRTQGKSILAEERTAAADRRGGREKRGWHKLRAKWRGEWRSACGHLRGMIGVR